MFSHTIDKLSKRHETRRFPAGKIARSVALGVTATVGFTAGALAADGPGAERPTGPVETPRTHVAYTDCPAGSPAGGFLDGDRVLATGRSGDGAWIEVRSPAEPGDPAWIPADAVRPDVSFADLPTSGCDTAAPLEDTTDDTPNGPTPTTTTTLPAPPPAGEDPQGVATDPADDTTTGEASPDDGASDEPADEPADEPTDEPADQPDDEPTDDSAPEIGAASADPGVIWEDGPVCDGKPRTASVSAEISDDSGVASATLTWSVGNDQGEIAMERSGATWSATVGPFDEDTIRYTTSEPIVLTVSATDEAGNTSSLRADEGTLELQDCTFG